MRGANGAGKLNQHARPEPAVKRRLVDLVEQSASCPIVARHQRLERPANLWVGARPP